MKRLLNELIFGRNAKISGLIALAVVGSIALGCNCGKGLDLSNISSDKNDNKTVASNDKTTADDDSVPSDSVVEALVKDTTAQFADAVDSGDFSDLHRQASSDFQATYTVDQMTTAFKTYTDKRSVVMPILKKVASSDADFTLSPSIRTEKGLKILVAQGKFPTKPFNVRFDYEYVMRGGEWKLLKLVINIP